MPSERSIAVALGIVNEAAPHGQMTIDIATALDAAHDAGERAGREAAAKIAERGDDGGEGWAGDAEREMQYAVREAIAAAIRENGNV